MTTTPDPLDTRPVDSEDGPNRLTAAELARWAWRQLTSMRTALMLLLLLGIAAVPGSLIPQRRVNPQAVSLWQADHPTLAPWVDTLGGFNVYGSAWFSAIYLLLMISLVGCVLPRVRIYARALSAKPPSVPRNLSRLPSSGQMRVGATPERIADRAVSILRRRGYRVVLRREQGVEELSAQRGYLREAGNLLFHLSLIVVLVAFAVGDLFGFRGGAVVLTSQTFANSRQSYDEFVPGTFFDADRLDPFLLTVSDFEASFLPTGQPSEFRAAVSYKSAPDAVSQDSTLEVNDPVDIDSTSIFLVGNGYAPVVTVRDGTGAVVYSGPTVFLPKDTTYASSGVIKVPDAEPTPLGFDGEFLPTYFESPQGAVSSQFPDILAPVLSLTVYRGDLGLGSGVPQSVYRLDKSSLDPVVDDSGAPITLTLPLGRARRLPGGLGTIRFDSVQRWTKLQISSTPAEPWALGGSVLGMLGLTMSLYVRPRRMWVRVQGVDAGSAVQVGGLDRAGGRDLDRAVEQLIRDLTEVQA